MNRWRWLSMVLLAVVLAAPVLADDLTGADRFLCTADEASICSMEGECVTAEPWTLNIPQFIEVDLAEKTLATTEASGEDRQTTIKVLEREGGLILIQGSEQGRAFSFVIAEEDGVASIAVARDGATVSVFGACTPMED